MVAIHRETVPELEVELATTQLGDDQVAQLAQRLVERLAPPFEKRRILQRLAEDAGPRAVGTLQDYAREPDPGFETAAEEALRRALQRTPEGAGYDRNSPCPCGSGAKWKHCCAREERWSGERAKITEAWR